VTVRKQRDISIDGSNSRDNPIGSNTDLQRRFAAWTAIAKHGPVGSRLPNFVGREAFIFAVVPLHKISIDAGERTESCKLAGVARPLERTTENHDKFFFGKNRLQLARELSAVLGERNIRDSGVPSIQAPIGFTVAQQIDFLFRVRHGVRTPCIKATLLLRPDDLETVFFSDGEHLFQIGRLIAARRNLRHLFQRLFKSTRRDDDQSFSGF
jgi:hypothetical protein